MTDCKSFADNRILDALWSTVHIAPDILAAESIAQTTKWFEYRFLSPKEATLHFLHVYQGIFRRQFREGVDRERADKVSGASMERLNSDSRERTQMWMARLRADLTGMRYEEYIEASFEFALHRGYRRQKFPRPNQLHSTGSAELPWNTFREKFWLERLESGSVPLPEHAAYRVEFYDGLDAQDEFRAFVLEYVNTSTSPVHFSMQTFVLQKRQVPMDAFKPLLPEDRWESVQAALASEESHSKTVPDVLPEVGKDLLWPSCFGIAAANDPALAESACGRCHVQAKCRRAIAGISDKLLKRNGTADPVLARRRKGANERQKRCRDNKRAKLLDAARSVQAGGI